MTLYIDITDAKEIHEYNGFIFAKGSQAGELMSNRLKKNDFNFQIISSYEDNLEFQHCRDKQSYDRGQFIAYGEFHPRTFLFRNENKMRESSQKFQYQINLFDQNNRDAGVLRCYIKFDPVLLFQGEFSNENTFKKRKKMDLYKGRAATKNLFSLMDPSIFSQENKWMESIYRDKQ